MDFGVSISTILEAQARIEGHALETPLLTNSSLQQTLGANVWLKCENMQPCGAFKMRGACNAVFSRSAAELAQGVVAHSSGNHASALSYAARAAGVAAYLVMPETAPRSKVALVRQFEGQITFCEATEAGRRGGCQELQEKTGALLVHPFEDPLVISGQGTVALEMLKQGPAFDTIVVPIGGGGLISGCATACKAMLPQLRVV
ncbi:MAG: pyridoxal-phosphate dependent enzyme, partial [Bdellovibrionales bacterium]|nr:pyridoxal-phosphate dependent enzyme [Bdellovibrionales bacterium]